MKLRFGSARVMPPQPCSEPGGWPEVEIALSYYGQDSALPDDALGLFKAAGREMLRVTDLTLGEVSDEMVERAAAVMQARMNEHLAAGPAWFRQEAHAALTAAFQDNDGRQEATDGRS